MGRFRTMSDASPSASPAGRARRAPRACESSRADLRSFASSVHRALTELDDPVDIASARSRSRARRIGPSPRYPIDIFLTDARHKQPNLCAQIATLLIMIQLCRGLGEVESASEYAAKPTAALPVEKYSLFFFGISTPSRSTSKVNPQVSARASLLQSDCSGRPQRLGRSRNRRVLARVVPQGSSYTSRISAGSCATLTARPRVCANRVSPIDSTPGTLLAPIEKCHNAYLRRPRFLVIDASRELEKSLRAVRRSSNRQPNDLADAARVRLCE
mmetsp:Transcript_21463/g.57313  ORF Transcript_21463/g.57313 Transcript_21463/m.57313 type:complete len:273 (-) Transcript_21463:144-962(-)